MQVDNNRLSNLLERVSDLEHQLVLAANSRDRDAVARLDAELSAVRYEASVLEGLLTLNLSYP